jgi:hypothetical protein
MWSTREVMGSPDSDFVELMNPEGVMVGNLFKDSYQTVLDALNTGQDEIDAARGEGEFKDDDWTDEQRREHLMLHGPEPIEEPPHCDACGFPHTGPCPRPSMSNWSDED